MATKRFCIILGLGCILMNGCRPRPDGSGLQDLQQLSATSFRSGVPTEKFTKLADPEHAGRQQKEQWCWAAATQMVLNFHGIAITQKELVRMMYGQVVDLTATPKQVAEMLNGRTFDTDTGKVKITAQAYSYGPTQALIDLLSYNQPPIIGLINDNGGSHAYVMTSLDWTKKASGPALSQVTLRNPWPDQASQQNFAARELSGKILGVVLIKVGDAEERRDKHNDPVALPPASSSGTDVALGGLGDSEACVMPHDAVDNDAEPACADWLATKK